MKLKSYIWGRWQFWLAIVMVIIASIAGMWFGASKGWKEQFSANLWSDLLVVIAITLLVIGSLERTARAEEEFERRKRVLTVLLKELQDIRIFVKRLRDRKPQDRAVPINPIPMGGVEIHYLRPTS